MFIEVIHDTFIFNSEWQIQEDTVIDLSHPYDPETERALSDSNGGQ